MEILIKIFTKHIFICAIFSFSLVDNNVLNAQPIPDYYDDFSDGKLQNRTGTDPWGRQLPEWSVLGVWDASSGEAQTDDGTISLPCNVTTGTWKFRYRYLNAPPTSNYNQGSFFYFIKQSNGSDLRLNNPTDGHWWLDYWATAEINDNWPRASHSYPYINMVGSCIAEDRVAGTSWHDVLFIRDDRGYVGTWLDGTFVEYSRDRNLDIIDNTFFELNGYGLTNYTLSLDNVEIYNGKFLIPNADISYASGIITINDYDVTLERIANSINNPSIFTYEQATNTGICYADILVKSGAEFQITNGILKMNDGKKLMYEREAMIFLDSAEITSVSSAPWYWEHSGPSSYGAVVLSIVNSTINNCGGFTAGGMKCLDFRNSNFTNLVGSEPFSVVFQRPTNGELLISGCFFEGKTGTETIYIRGGAQFHQLNPEPYGMDIINTVFNNIILLAAYDYPYYLSPGRPHGIVNLINTKISTLDYNGSFYREKYYLDVKVVDQNGNPVPGATVNVINEQDNLKYPAENLLRSWKYLKVGDQVTIDGEDYFEGQQGNWFKGLVNVNDHSSAITGQNGHTPLPSDTTGTFVITGRTSGQPTNSSPWAVNTYTYTIIAEKDGIRDSVININPDTLWYRADPNTYPGFPGSGTITIVLPIITDIITTNASIPKFAVFPNPAKGKAQIKFVLAKIENVQISIYNILGEELGIIANGEMSMGDHKFDISNYLSVAGVYILRIKTGNTVNIRKILNLK